MREINDKLLERFNSGARYRNSGGANSVRSIRGGKAVTFMAVAFALCFLGGCFIFLGWVLGMIQGVERGKALKPAEETKKDEIEFL